MWRAFNWIQQLWTIRVAMHDAHHTRNYTFTKFQSESEIMARVCGTNHTAGVPFDVFRHVAVLKWQHTSPKWIWIYTHFWSWIETHMPTHACMHGSVKYTLILAIVLNLAFQWFLLLFSFTLSSPTFLLLFLSSTSISICWWNQFYSNFYCQFSHCFPAQQFHTHTQREWVFVLMLLSVCMCMTLSMLLYNGNCLFCRQNAEKWTFYADDPLTVSCFWK